VDRKGANNTGVSDLGVSLSRAFRKRCARIFVAGIGIVFVLGSILGFYIFSKLYQEECGDIEVSTLSAQEMASLNRMVENYAIGPLPKTPLKLSLSELDFFMQEVISVPTRTRVTGDQLTWVGHFSSERGCVRVLFEGTVRVVNGQLVLRPNRLDVGRLHLGGVLAGTTIRPRSIWFASQEFNEYLANILELNFSGEYADLTFKNRRKLL
jgi:hypothetical protein